MGDILYNWYGKLNKEMYIIYKWTNCISANLFYSLVVQMLESYIGVDAIAGAPVTMSS